MDVKEALRVERNHFVSVYDLVNELADSADCSLSDAASYIRTVIFHEGVLEAHLNPYGDLESDSDSGMPIIVSDKLLKQIILSGGFNDYAEENTALYSFEDYKLYGWYREGIAKHFLGKGTELFCLSDCAAQDWIFDGERPDYSYEEQFVEAERRRRIFNAKFQEELDSKLEKESEDNLQKNDTTTLPFLNKQHSCYSKKLAATIACWEFVSKQVFVKNKTRPKKLAEEWFDENHQDFGLKKSENLKEKIADIVNFREKSGAYNGWPED